MKKSQKKIFIEHEADDWFTRNLSQLEKNNYSEDPVIKLLQSYDLTKGNLLEVGSSAGFRLKYIQDNFPELKTFGIDPSKKAIHWGERNFNLNLKMGTGDDLSMYEDNYFDVLVIGFVFYVVDRTLLFKTFAEIDRVLKDGGVLIIIDFFSARTIANKYSHVETEAYSYKQKYEESFIASGLYHLLDKSTFSHTDKSYCANDDFYNKYCVSLLKKALKASYLD